MKSRGIFFSLSLFISFLFSQDGSFPLFPPFPFFFVAMSAQGANEPPTLKIPTPRRAKPAGHVGAEDELREVMSTNDDALVAKRSCAARGFFHDPFVSYFGKALPSRGGDDDGRVRSYSPFSSRDDVPRVSPLIHRGYFSRVVAIRLLIARFISAAATTAEKKAQIVNLGAGSDTAFFCLASQAKEQGVEVRWVDLDLPTVIANRIAVIRRTPVLAQLVGTPVAGSDTADPLSLVCESYAALAADLRNPVQLSSLLVDSTAALGVLPLQRDTPTLFISECVLIYLQASQGSDVIAWARDAFPTSGFLCYEQILPDDAFGKMMVGNLRDRGCPLQSIADFPSIEAQQQRYLARGYPATEVRDMLEIYNHFLPQDEKARANKLEIFDEIEEWVLIQRHYCLVSAFSSCTEEWAAFRKALQL